MNEVILRPAVQEDLPFIFSTWLKSYRYNSQFAKKLTNEVFYTWHHKVIERIIERGASVIVACDGNSPSVLFGYLVMEANGLVHFVYIKKSFRKMGIAKKLLANLSQGVFTHYTEFCDEYLKTHEGWIYNPYLI